MSLAGKVAIVTGAGSGIGAAVCEVFDREGATLVAADIDGEAATRQAKQLTSASAATLDVSDVSAVDRLVAATAENFGRIDVLAHVAGIDDVESKARLAECQAQGLPPDVTATLRDDQWHRMLSVNLTAPFYLTRAALRVMVPQGHGSIVHVSSIAGLYGHPGLPHYSAAKAGLLGFIRSVAKEVRDHGVRVNAVAPGGVDTPMFARTRKEGIRVPSLPMGRPAAAHEVAETILFLASDASSYVTGETITVDGGG